jgi:uncharacterized protein
VRDLERSDQRRRWDISPAWIDWALRESDAKSDGTTGSLEVYLKKSGPEVLVKGEVRASVTMPCARTLEPVPVKLEADMYLLLTPRREPNPPATAKASRARTQRAARKDLGAAAGVRVRGKEPFGKAQDDDGLEEQLSADLAARDEYDGEKLVLDGFVREHLMLELPLFPVKSDLPFDLAPATDTPPDEPGIDPRLAPLAALASELQRAGKIAKSGK